MRWKIRKKLMSFQKLAFTENRTLLSGPVSFSDSTKPLFRAFPPI